MPCVRSDAADENISTKTTSMYEGEATCTEITIWLGLSFGKVFRILDDGYRKGYVRI